MWGEITEIAILSTTGYNNLNLYNYYTLKIRYKKKLIKQFCPQADLRGPGW